MQDGSGSTAEPARPEEAEAESSAIAGPDAPNKIGEGRAAPRRRVLLSGKLTYGDGLSMDCPIREESDTGARVVVGAQLLPRQVVLVSLTRGVAYDAEVVWRRGKEAGLRFLKAYPLRSDAFASASPVELARKLWAESLARGSD